MFWPIRRSILYFASLRLVIASSGWSMVLRRRALLCLPKLSGGRQVQPPKPEADGPRVAKRFAGRNRPASRAVLRGKAAVLSTKRGGFDETEPGLPGSRRGQRPGFAHDVNC